MGLQESALTMSLPTPAPSGIMLLWSNFVTASLEKHPAIMAGQAIGQFQILGTLGQGANSTILHVRCSNDSKQYALKVVPIEGKEDQKFLDQAQHEFKIAQLLDHKNLIKIYALETPRDWLFRIRKVHLLIEYVNGLTLDKVKKLSTPVLLQVFEKVASGMVQMHRRGVCHADLKPNNIMLSRTGDVKIIDYGLARIKGESSGRVQGTPEYMAPEQARQGTVNERTDIFNLGATMYRLVTFRLPPNPLMAADNIPMSGKTYKSMLKPVCEVSPQAPRELATLIEQCLDFNSNKRPERMSEIQGALDHMVDHFVTSSRDRLEHIEW
jgi:serine/threonine protein kinase